MIDASPADKQIQYVSTFEDLVSASFCGERNAVCWDRKLTGDFSEIVEKIDLKEDMAVIEPVDLMNLQLSEQGKLARNTLLNDMELLRAYGAEPVLNVIRSYEKDDAYPFFPTDVYSFHVDRSPIPTDTFLCTYYGESSEIVPHSQAKQKIHIPAIRSELKKLYNGLEEEFESFLTEYFFDLHYQVEENVQPTRLGLGQLWRLAVDHPGSHAFPCVHRAPIEKPGQRRLLLIC